MTSSWHRSHVILVDFADLKGRPDRWCPALECCVVNECRILAFAFRWFSRGQISAMTMGYISLMICDLNNLLNDIAREQHNFQWTLIALMPTFKYLYTGNLLSIYKLSREEPANAIVGVMAIIYPNYCTFKRKVIVCVVNVQFLELFLFIQKFQEGNWEYPIKKSIVSFYVITRNSPLINRGTRAGELFIHQVLYETGVSCGLISHSNDR